MSNATHTPADDAPASDLLSTLLERLPQYGVPPAVIAQWQAAVHAIQTQTHELILELQDEVAMREQLQHQLEHQVMHDALTNLPNLLFMRDQLHRALARLRRYPERGFALLSLDIDGFKHFNEDLGHQAGDAVLYELAQRLLESVRPTDVVARLSSDDFVILADTGDQPEAALRIAQRVLQAMQTPMHIAEQALQVPVSIGITPGHRHYHSIDEVLHDADVALTQAKQQSPQKARYARFSRFSAAADAPLAPEDSPD